ncbi:uncharacterized protein LOC114523370 [Dendronephthya gigantea]|uniref:uncharacterized protein LOC114523370 n=1 Tax=Dendronephthya gigantea TaxID=151771 RepID=UPI0010693489|nr:uncharacterized protein LOC114523370 [Dendronephthya gigantea]
MESDDEENFTESDQSKTSIKSDEEGNLTESDLSKSSMNIDDEEDFSGCDLSLSNSGYLENEFFEYLQYVVSCCLDPEYVNCDDSQDELKISKTKIETKIEDLKKMLESEA